GCDSTVHLILTVLNNDGIPVIETANVEIFPNPAHALLNIKGENMRKILIYNTDGQIVYFTDENVNDLQQVDVSRYAAGQYLVKVQLNDGRTATRKIIVSRR
nr:T9SS type A sorting domain-containing protein [Bacteroidales bacterium]